MSQAAQDAPSPQRPEDGPSGCTAARLFHVLWENLADVLGAAATAALVRRSAKRVASRVPGRESVAVAREGFTYRYTLPARWNEEDRETLVALRDLVKELLPILAELTGPVVVRRIEALAELRRCGVLLSEVE